MERVTFLVEDTHERITAMLNPASVVGRRSAVVRERRSIPIGPAGAFLPLLHRCMPLVIVLVFLGGLAPDAQADPASKANRPSISGSRAVSSLAVAQCHGSDRPADEDCAVFKTLSRIPHAVGLPQ